MTIKSSFIVVGITVLAVLVGTTAQATVVFEYLATGSNDPTLEGFTLGGTLPPVSAFGGTEVSGIHFWEMTSASNSRARYSQSPTGVLGAEGWTLTWRVKVGTDVDRPLEAQMSVIDAPQEFQFGLDGGPGGFSGNDREPGAYFRHANFDWIQVSSVDPTSGYFTWQTYLDAKGNFDKSDDEVSYYLDGTLLATVNRSALSGTDTDTTSLWGDNNPSVGGTTRTNLFRFETGKQIVPEPSTLTLLGFGLLSLIALAWRRRRRCEQLR